MKVLMVNSPNALKLRGGDLTQMRQTAAALAARGVEVGESFEREPDARGFDLAHVFNVRTLDVTARQVQALNRAGVPVVMSPIYLNPAVALWADVATRYVFKSRPAEELPRLLEAFRLRRLRLRHRGQTYSAYNENRPRAGHDGVQRQILNGVRHLLPNSYLEMHSLARTLRVADIPFTVVPYAADAATFLDADAEPFVAKYGLRDFVLQVGRIEWCKNALLLACALRDLDLPLVLIGQSLQPDYLDFIRKYGPKKLHIIPHLPTGELRHAYAAARVHALPSWVETCGLVHVEAALANCNLVASIAGYEVEFFRNFAYYCDPADVGSIRQAVQAAHANYDRDAGRRSALKEVLLREYTWDRAAEATLSGYRQALGG